MVSLYSTRYSKQKIQMAPAPLKVSLNQNPKDTVQMQTQGELTTVTEHVKDHNEEVSKNMLKGFAQYRFGKHILGGSILSIPFWAMAPIIMK